MIVMEIVSCINLDFNEFISRSEHLMSSSMYKRTKYITISSSEVLSFGYFIGLDPINRTAFECEKHTLVG